ncbi:MAG: VapB-type antitoxin [Nitrososphaerales archaeon]
MPIISVRVDDKLKQKKDQLKEVNWSEVTRKVIGEKIRETELWQPVDVILLVESSTNTDALRKRIEGWDSTTEIRRWRERDLR